MAPVVNGVPSLVRHLLQQPVDQAEGVPLPEHLAAGSPRLDRLALRRSERGIRRGDDSNPTNLRPSPRIKPKEALFVVVGVPQVFSVIMKTPAEAGRWEEAKRPTTARRYSNRRFISIDCLVA